MRNLHDGEFGENKYGGSNRFLFSGIVGCASAPIFLGRSFGFFIWAIVKSFISAAGVLMAVSIYGGIHKWSGWNFEGATAMAGMSLMVLLFAFYLLSSYREITHQSDDTNSIHNTKLKQKLLAWAAWMSRNVHK